MPPAFCFCRTADPSQTAGMEGSRLAFPAELNYQTAMATHAIPLAKLPSKSAARMPAASPAATKASPWILDRWRDLLLFVGTPVLLIPLFTAAQARWSAQDIDRKSTRLNSSHGYISYAVFCLKKKKKSY